MAKTNPAVESLKTQTTPTTAPPAVVNPSEITPVVLEKATGVEDSSASIVKSILQETLDALKKEREAFKLELIAAKEELSKVKEELKTRTTENKATTTPVNTVIKEIPPATDTPPEGMIRRKVQVNLKDCASRVIYVDHSPGNEISVRDIAVAKFNEYFHIIGTEHSHSVSLITDTTPEG